MTVSERLLGERANERTASSVFSAPGDLLRTHWPVTVASFRTWRGWRDCVAQDPAHV